MAEIYGVKITGMKTYIGTEGPAAQGNVRLNGKLLGFWSQDGNGGSDRYEFDTTELMEAAEKHFRTRPENWEYRSLYANEDGTVDRSYLDAFMYELIRLADEEKKWKEMAKKGYPVMVCFHEAPDPKYPQAEPVEKVTFVHSKYLGSTDSEILSLLEIGRGKGSVVIDKIYKKAEDFVIR